MTVEIEEVETPGEPSGEPEAESEQAPKTVAHPSDAQRAQSGKAARERAPRAGHSALDKDAIRDPIGWLEEQAPSRVPELVPIRYGRMLVSPFAFYRGAANIMAHDLAPLPRTGLTVQLCGDTHLSNFGGFASPERAMIFDLNDFDETLPGPFEWDLKRLAASFEIAARDRGFASADRRAAVLGVARAYREAMREFATMDNLAVWYSRISAEDIQALLRNAQEQKQAKAFQRGIAKARTKDRMKAFSKLTRDVDGEPKFVSDPPLIVPIEDLARTEGLEQDFVVSAVMDTYRSYRRSLQPDRRVLLERFRYADLARKVVGVGSVGTRAWVMLLLGSDDGDPLFIQVKEAQASVLEPHLGRSRYRNHGQRVVEGQRLMQAASDIFLGWTRAKQTFEGTGTRDFYGRQLWDWKASLDIETVALRGLQLYAGLCGWTLARAHARSGDRIAIASYLGKTDVFDRALADFSEAYADLNERDYNALTKAVRDGRITAREGL